MSFQMKVSKEQIEGQDVVPPGIYEVRLIGFKPKFSKNSPGDLSKINLNAQMEIINHPDLVGRKIYEGLNMSAGWVQSDFCHAFGLPMETDGDSSWIPGTWDSDKATFNPADDKTFKYQGPLLNKVAKVEVAVTTYDNKQQNKVQRYFCIIKDCETKFPKIRHSQNLLAKSS